MSKAGDKKRNGPGWMPAVLFLVLALACSGDDDGDDNPAGPAGPQLIDSLVVQRSDGSTIDIPNRSLSWCGEWEPGTVPTEAIHLIAGFDTSFGADNPRWFYLRGVLADLTVGDTLEIANDFVWDQPEDLEIYLLDDPNEMGTWTGGTRGTIVFEELRCGEDGVVRFRLDGVIGSEAADGDSARVTGLYQSPVGESPF